jgi:FkbM family methyltransferase
MVRQLSRLFRGDKGRGDAIGGRLRLGLSYSGLLVRQRLGARGASMSQRHEVTLRGQRLTSCDLDTLRFSVDEIFVDRSYACSLPPSPTIVDCGANIGVATAFFLTEHPGATLIAIEPDPSCFELLSLNIRRNGWKNVTAHNVAAGRVDGSTTFFRDPSKPASLVGSTTRRVLDKEEIAVETRRLSGFLPESVDLLKLDVEGAESEILAELADAGALARVAAVVVEFHHDPRRPALLGDFLTHLDKAGFACEIRGAWRGAAPAGESSQDVLIYASRSASFAASSAG